ncbi:hypothetical protein, partial [Escherichia coli]|uniref:hypothetical protein n=1 Tax=Escherichia coli TaxID=562 RepID=UPI001BC9D8E4
ENNKNGHLELTGGHSWDSIPDSLQNAIEEREASHSSDGSTLKLALMGFTHAFPLCMGRSNISATLMNTVQSLIR